MARKAGVGRQTAWSRDEILEGVKLFIDDHGRFPMSHEMDKFEYLPSARSIQRNFGGLIELKKELGITDEYHRGQARSKISAAIGLRGLNIEDEMRNQLVARFGQVAVHCQPRIEGSKERLDFIVYHKAGHFGVDVFFADSIESLQGSVNIKQAKYKHFTGQLYFVSAGDFSDAQLKAVKESKKNKLTLHIKLVTTNEFYRLVHFFRPLLIT